jgi:hypothetical protein
MLDAEGRQELTANSGPRHMFAQERFPKGKGKSLVQRWIDLLRM